MKESFKRFIALFMAFCIISTANHMPVHAVDQIIFNIDSAFSDTGEQNDDLPPEEGGDSGHLPSTIPPALGQLHVVPYAGIDRSDILKDPKATVVQQGNVVDSGGKLDSRLPLMVEMSFGIPLLGSGDAVYVEKGDKASFAFASGFEMVEYKDGVAVPLPSAVFEFKQNGIKIGTLTLSAAGNQEIVASVLFDGADEVFDGAWSNASCKFNIALQYAGTGAGGEEGNHDTLILEKVYTVVVPPAENKVAVKKSGAVQGQFIDWVVKAEAQKGTSEGTLGGYSFFDDIELVGTYEQGSFRVGTTSDISQAVVLDSAADFSAADGKLNYAFEENAMGTRYLFFRTKISNDKFFSNGDQQIDNTAQLLKQASPVSTSKATVKFKNEWIKKEVEAINSGTGHITWTITVNQAEANLVGAFIKDELDSKLVWVGAKLERKNPAGSSPAWSTVETFTTQPSASQYDLGNISTPMRLTLEAKIRPDLDIAHTVQSVTNKATFGWAGGTGVVSKPVESGIGFNPIKKSSEAYDVTTHKATWQVSVDNSDIGTNLRVVDLLVYANTFDRTKAAAIDNNAGKPLTRFTLGDLEHLTPSYNQRYDSGSWQSDPNSALALTVHTVTDVNGHAIADLLVVTNEQGEGIDVSSTTQSFRFQTQVTNPNVYLNNKTGQKEIKNNASLFSNTTKVNSAEASRDCASNLLEKDTLSAADAVSDLTLPVNANKGAADSKKSFNYQDKSVVFRLHINASGVVDVVGGPTTIAGKQLGKATVTDVLPQGWEFVDIAANTPFLLYEGTGQAGKVVANRLLTTHSFVTADFSVGGTASFTFTQLNQPYLILVKAQPNESTTESYFKENKQSISIVNNVSLKAEQWDGSAVADEGVSFESKALSKELESSVEGALSWALHYNPYSVEYPDAVIKDTLPYGLDLRTDASGALDMSEDYIAIDAMSMNSDGTLSKVGSVDALNYVEYDPGTRVLSFEVPEVAKGYRFRYVTDVTGKVADNLTNTASLAQALNGESRVGVSYQVGWADANAVMERSGCVKITKKNTAGEVLSNAEFTIFTADGVTPLRKGKTDERGALALYGLPEGRFILRETQAPAGYSLSNIAYTVVVEKTSATTTKTTILGNSGAVPNEITITNVAAGVVGAVSINKQISGNAAEGQKAFDFSITVGSASGTYPYTKNQTTSGTILFTNGKAQFQLMGGEDITIEGLPQGAAYQVEESDYTAQGYITTKAGDTGVVLSDRIRYVTFVNTKNSGGGNGGGSNATPAHVMLRAEKTLDGRAPRGSEYSFSLKDSEGRTLQTSRNNNQEVLFERLSFDHAGVYLYTMSENAGSNANINYDDAVYTVVITVTQPKNFLAEVSYLKNGVGYQGVPLFANTTERSSGGGGDGGDAPMLPPGSAGLGQNGAQGLPPVADPPADKKAEGLIPETGQSNSDLFWMISLLLSAAGMAWALCRKKQRAAQK